MAQYFLPFSGEPLGAIDSGKLVLALANPTAGWTIVEENVEGGTERLLKRASGGSGNSSVYGLLWTEHNTELASTSEIDVLVLAASSAASRAIGCILAAANILPTFGSDGDGYLAGSKDDNTATRWLLRFDDSGSADTLQFPPAVQLDLQTGATIGNSQFWYHRLNWRRSDGRLQYRSWRFGDSEPGTWLLAATDANYDVIFAGLHSQRPAIDQWFRFLAIGTNGDLAPLEAVSVDPNSPISELVDTFDGPDVNENLWTQLTDDGATSAEIVDGELVLTADRDAGAFGAIRLASVDRWDLTDDRWGIELVSPASGGPAVESHILVARNLTNYAAFSVIDGNLLIRSVVAGALSVNESITYDPQDHRYLGFEHDEGTDRFHWLASADGENWTSLHDVATEFDVDALEVWLESVDDGDGPAVTILDNAGPPVAPDYDYDYGPADYDYPEVEQPLDGESEGNSLDEAAASLGVSIAGESEGESEDIAAIGGQVPISGESEGESQDEASIAAKVSIEGESQGESEDSASVSEVVSLVGESIGESEDEATVTAIEPPPPGVHQVFGDSPGESLDESDFDLNIAGILVSPGGSLDFGTITPKETGVPTEPGDLVGVSNGFSFDLATITGAAGDIVISMLQVHTQVRSERIGREHQITEVYSNQGFNRRGGGS